MMSIQSFLSLKRVLTKFTSKAAGFLMLLQLAPVGLTAGQASEVTGSVSDVTIALTVTWTKENASKTSGTTQTTSGTSVSASLGNKDFLQYMKVQGNLADTSITGWKIVYVNSDEISGLFATKTGKAPVKVPEDLLLLSSSSAWGDDVYGEAETYSQTYKGSVFVSSSLTGRYLGSISGSFPAGSFKGLQFKAQGIASSSSSSTAQGSEVFKSRKLTGLVGAVDTASAGGLDIWVLPILEGSVSMGASVSADVSAFSAANN